MEGSTGMSQASHLSYDNWKPSIAIKARAKVDIEPITMPFRKCDVLLLLMGETPI
jgi:hypothetical protein